MKSVFPILLASSFALILSVGCSDQTPKKLELPPQPSESLKPCTPEFAAEYETYLKLKLEYVPPEQHWGDRPVTTTAEMRASCERALTNMSSFKGGRNCSLVTSSGQYDEALYSEDVSFCRKIFAGQEYPNH